MALKLPTSVSDFFTKVAIIQEHYSDHNWIPITTKVPKFKD